MSINLIIAGVTLFFASAVFCVMDPSRREQKWVLASLFVPILAIPYYRQRWDELFILGYAQVVGLVLILIGGVFLVQEHTAVVHGQRVFIAGQQPANEPFTNAYSGNRIADEEKDPDAELKSYIESRSNRRLSGNLRGEEFGYGRAELIDGVLRLKQSPGFYSNLEVAIHWGVTDKELESKATKFVVPNSENPPEIHVSWVPKGKSVPETDIIRSGYQMELALARISENQLRGQLKLMLPDKFQSKVSGRFTAYTNNLHYKQGKVDLNHDHNDTLEYVVSEYLQTQYPEDAIKEITYTHTHFKPISKVGSTVAKVTTNDGAVIQQQIGLQKNVAGWIIDAERLGDRVYLMRPSDSAIDLFADDVLKDPRLERQKALERKRSQIVIPDPITVDFADLAQYANKEVVAVTRSGKKQEGLYTGISNKRIVIESVVGTGTVQYFIDDEEIDTLTLVKSRQLIHVRVPEEQ